MKVHEFFTDETTWCKVAYGLDSDGNKLLPGSLHKAVKCCLLGAIYKCYPTSEAQRDAILTLQAALMQLSRERMWKLSLERSLTIFNDQFETTFAMVKDVADLAQV